MDHCLQLVTPSDYVDLQSTDALTVVVPYICDVSCVRAFVVKYADELQNDGDVKSNTTGMQNVQLREVEISSNTHSQNLTNSQMGLVLLLLLF